MPNITNYSVAAGINQANAVVTNERLSSNAHDESVRMLVEGLRSIPFADPSKYVVSASDPFKKPARSISNPESLLPPALEQVASQTSSNTIVKIFTPGKFLRLFPVQFPVVTFLVTDNHVKVVEGASKLGFKNIGSSIAGQLNAAHAGNPEDAVKLTAAWAALNNLLAKPPTSAYKTPRCAVGRRETLVGRGAVPPGLFPKP